MTTRFEYIDELQMAVAKTLEDAGFDNSHIDLAAPDALSTLADAAESFGDDRSLEIVLAARVLRAIWNLKSTIEKANAAGDEMFEAGVLLGRAEMLYLASGQPELAKAFDGSSEKMLEGLSLGNRSKHDTKLRWQGFVDRFLETADWTKSNAALAVQFRSAKPNVAPPSDGLDKYIRSIRNAIVGDVIRPFTREGITHEAAFNRVVAAAQSGPRADIASLQALRRIMPTDAGRQVTAGVIRSMGRDANGHFSADAFATAMDKMTPAGKAALFGKDSQHLGDLEALERIAKAQKAAGKFYNHSQSGNHATGLLGAIELGKSAMEGNHKETAAMVALGGVGYAAAHLLASPGFARLVIRASRPSMSAGAISRAFSQYAADHPAIASDVQKYASRLRQNTLPMASGNAAGTFLRPASASRTQ